jgi:hypothetical protein
MARDTLAQIFVTAAVDRRGNKHSEANGRFISGGGGGRSAPAVKVEKALNTKLAGKPPRTKEQHSTIKIEKTHPAATAVKGREGWKTPAAGTTFSREVHYESPGGSLGGIMLHKDGSATGWSDRFTTSGNVTDITKKFKPKDAAKAHLWVEEKTALADEFLL